jgi:hypothetical protein
MVSFDSTGGDMSKHPSLMELASLALSIIRQRERSFSLTLGPWRYEKTRAVLEAWTAQKS